MSVSNAPDHWLASHIPHSNITDALAIQYSCLLNVFGDIDFDAFWPLTRCFKPLIYL